MSTFAIRCHRKVLWAVIWEHWRCGWWRLLNAQIAVLGVAMVVFSSLEQIGPLDAGNARTLHMIFLWSVLVATGGTASMIRGDARRYFGLPLSNSFVAVTVLLPGMLCLAAGWGFTVAMMDWLFRVNWPWAGPALFMAAFWGAIQAGTHIVGSNRLLRFAVWSLVPLVLGGWLCWRHEGTSLLSPRTMWATVTLLDLLTLGGLIFLEFLVLPRCIARERSGDNGLLDLSWGNTSHIPERWIPRREAASRRFASAADAQFWFEWQQKGWLLPATLAVFLLFLVLGYAFRFYGAYELLHSGLGYGIGLVPFSVVMGLVLGHADLQEKQVEYTNFLGTRPMTNWQLSAALLKVEAISLLLTWAAWCAWLALATVILYASEGVAPVWDLWTEHGRFALEYAALGNSFAVVLVAMALLFAWIGLTLSSSLVLTGRRNWLIAVVSGAIPLFILTMATASTQHQDAKSISFQLYRTVSGVAATLSFATILGFAWHHTAIDRRIVRNLLVLLLTSNCVAAPLIWRLGWRSGPDFVLMLGTIALAITPFATAPLALSWNRHR